MRTKVLPVVLLAALLGGGLAGCTEPDAPATTPAGTTTPVPTSTPEVEAPSTGATDGPATPDDDAGAPAPDAGSAPAPAPVPESEADGWTDETAYQACVAHATETEGAGYTWSVRAGQTMVYQDGRRTIDVAGIYTGGDVGVANVVYRCTLDGGPSDPRIDGAVVR